MPTCGLLTRIRPYGTPFPTGIIPFSTPCSSKNDVLFCASTDMTSCLSLVKRETLSRSESYYPISPSGFTQRLRSLPDSAADLRPARAWPRCDMPEVAGGSPSQNVLLVAGYAHARL